MEATERLDDQARYRALCSHDARFDGRLFVGVTSTGIYCRPVCRVRTPRRENCRFFDHAAQAEQAGFRPCLRCRPELAPLQRHWSHEDASAILAQQATRWLDDPQQWSADTDTATPTLERLAARLGVSSRHLRRVFEAQLGVSPLQYLLTRKLLTAKQLLADTRLPITQVAQASGFASLRRFNAAFAGHYGLNPTQLRSGSDPGAGRAPRPLALAWRPPYDAAALLRFLSARQLPGIEQVDSAAALSVTRTARLEHAGKSHTGWFQARFEPGQHRLWLSVSDGLHPALPALIWRVRAWFDLDADPQPINALLHTDFPGGDGLRVPGAFDGFELAVRAVLGQQISVAAARTLTMRLVDRLGEPMETAHPALNRLFPSAHAIAGADPALLGELGIVRQRQAALQALARAVLDGTLTLNNSADHQRTTQALMALPGIGPWTAQYIALRALRWPDAWPTGDVALTLALGLPAHRSAAAHRAADQLAQRWRPWRSYAVIRAWSGTHVSQESPP